MTNPTTTKLSKYDHSESCGCNRCLKAAACKVELYAEKPRHTVYKVKSTTGRVYMVVIDLHRNATCSCECGQRNYHSHCAHQQAARWEYEKMIRQQVGGIRNPVEFESDGMLWA